MKLTSLLLYALSATSPADTVIFLPDVVISAPIKHNNALRDQPFSATNLSMAFMENNRVTEPKDISLTVPNLVYADYGSKMTSSVYIRGMGSRMENPAMGLYVDNVPVLNKNNYDFDYFDVKTVNVLRGPQGTLYGRNTIGGVIDVHTLSPFEYQGVRLRAEYGNGDSWGASAGVYHRASDNLAWSMALNHRESGGFFTNEYDGSSADRIRNSGGRFRILGRLSERWTLENSFHAGLVKQKGFAYGLYDEATGKTAPVNHNDPCTYDRTGLANGLTLRYTDGRLRFSSTTGYQFIDDEMVLDQDFLPKSMFTLSQKQRENAFTQEFILRPAQANGWDWLTGAFAFYKHMDMHAPVTFKKDGIEELILGKANQGIHIQFPDADLVLKEEEFPIESRFKLPVYGFSLFHQSTLTSGKWKFTAGLRADYESTGIRYNSHAEVNYRFTLTMPEYKAFPVEMEGKKTKSFSELLPRLSVMYEIPAGNLYASASRGYKAGGYNTQIFSDLLQSEMMNGLMADLGLYPKESGAAYDTQAAISYKPEYSWNYEIGTHLETAGNKLYADACAFYIDCRDQQLTVYPPGQSTGRLMSNAGRTRSYGAELTAGYRTGGLNLTGAYGYTNATFRKYESGDDDFSGNYVPYAPGHTVAVNARYLLNLPGKWIDAATFNLGWQGAGKIYWNEENTITEPFYGLLNASVTVRKGIYTLGVWGKNLTETNYNTFYFESIGNSFMQRGKPLQAGIFLTINI